ncbi:hypothetical protein [Pseudarthrobacter sp. DSP2-3-2b1]|uniref:hypothetical protein n=1 Tax=Pseudarthrobacter sp. DSP2-3-2b1 TaxID=2804661 RepID=UPI003CF1605C
MREPYVHEASLVMDAEGDPGAPGAAITVELCGSWEHTPPCPLAPHHTSHQRAGDEVALRVVFAAEPEAESEVRRRIDSALAAGSLTGPDGVRTDWSLRGSAAGVLTTAERGQAERIAAT